ncbi:MULTISPECIES: CoA-transferase [Exiguobacterium]|uniref:CoA-transferase n=1 Tax=Exiguobacterium TaxID=33986 RepID=UPI000304D536|nr:MULTISPECIES: CoA-transferase [Exiguobacterium]MCT4779771.1 hypothetical protein [Exiguobacterium soli]
MELVIILLALSLLMFVAYRGFSVILFAPICALFAVLLTNPDWVLPFFSNIFMEKMVGFIKAYFPVFLLGAIFGKVVEMSGIAESIAKSIIRMIGTKRVVIIMEHVNKYGESKVKTSCTLPLTGSQVVNRLITDKAVFDFTESGMVLIEALNGLTVEDIRAVTEANFTVSPELERMPVGE